MKEVQNAAEQSATENQSILLIGPVGQGKTTLYRTLPGRKFVYCFDPNAKNALRGSKDIDFVEFTPDVSDVDIAVKTLKAKTFDSSSAKERKEPTTYTDWEADWEERYATGFFEKYDWIIFDSLTTLSEIIMDRVQHLNMRLGKQPEQADWAAEMNTMKSIVRAAMSVGNVVCVAHTETDKDELTGAIHGKLVLTGKGRLRVPLRFSHIIGCKTDRNSKGEQQYFSKTTQDRMWPAVRTSIEELKGEVDVTIDFNKPLEGQGLGRFFTRRHAA